jgi:hypothetical protein
VPKKSHGWVLLMRLELLQIRGDTTPDTTEFCSKPRNSPIRNGLVRPKTTRALHPWLTAIDPLTCAADGLRIARRRRGWAAFEDIVE